MIAALADDEVTESGKHRERLLNLQNRLSTEFGLGEHQARGGESEVPDGRDAIAGDEDVLDEGDGILDLGDEDEETVEFSRAEAKDILDALEGYEASDENRVISRVRDRLMAAFE